MRITNAPKYFKMEENSEGEHMNGMGKCKFAASWLEVPDYKEWLQPVEGNVRDAYCTLYK